jgi:hypothetical protein
VCGPNSDFGDPKMNSRFLIILVGTTVAMAGAMGVMVYMLM